MRKFALALIWLCFSQIAFATSLSTLAPLAARTTTGEGGDVQIISGQSARCYLNVTAASGTSPTLDVTIVGVVDGADYTLFTFAQKTAAGVETVRTDDVPDVLKAKWTIAGTTPSFTFEVICARH